jgi:hypothetical protein
VIIAKLRIYSPAGERQFSYRAASAMRRPSASAIAYRRLPVAVFHSSRLPIGTRHRRALEGLAEAVNGLERARQAPVWSDHSEYRWLAIPASKHDHESWESQRH